MLEAEARAVYRSSRAVTGVTWPWRSRTARRRVVVRRAALLLLLYHGCLLVGACAREAERPAIPSDLEAVIAARDPEGLYRLEREKLGALVGREGVIPELLTESGRPTSIRDLIGDGDGIVLLFMNPGNISKEQELEIAEMGWRYEGKPVYPVLPRVTRFTTLHEQVLRRAPSQVLFVETPMVGEMVYLRWSPTLFIFDRSGRVALIHVDFLRERGYQLTAVEEKR